MTLHKVLVANRGVAAVRIARTLRQMGIVSVGLCQASEADADYLSVFDEVHPLVGDTVADTFLNQAAVLVVSTVIVLT